VSARQRTRGTELAALEAQRNEAQVRADGGLLGERRASVARLAMIAMFAVVSNLDRSSASRHTQTIVGAVYTVWVIGTFYTVWFRLAQGSVGRSRWMGVVLATIDFALITTMAMLQARHGSFVSGKHAIAAAIVLSYSVARASSWHIVYSLVLAELSWVIVALTAGNVALDISVFVMGGFAVLGFMLLLTNRAVAPMFAGLRQRDNLTRFLPRQVAERVMRDGPNALAPVQREITVLFSDIRGFTGMSEGLEPREVLSMLDDYFARMSQIVKGHDGVVGKFLGDGLLAFWGVPDRLDDHAVHAVNAARDMRIALRELNRHRAHEGKPPIKIGIGVHTGTVAAGMLGGALQSEYTVIGDAVNVASRIEGLTKEHAVDLLISETTWSQLGGKRSGRRLADAEIRGRREAVTLYTIDDDPA
jgi:adenylate cyclase